MKGTVFFIGGFTSRSGLVFFFFLQFELDKIFFGLYTRIKEVKGSFTLQGQLKPGGLVKGLGLSFITYSVLPPITLLIYHT